MPQFASKRRVGHSADEMFDLVADVERYPEFVPLCTALKVRQRIPKDDGTEVIVADMLGDQHLPVERDRHPAPSRPQP